MLHIAAVATLTLALYNTEQDMTNDTPVVSQSYYSSQEECNTQRTTMIPQLDEKLANGLLAYSITCETK